MKEFLQILRRFIPPYKKYLALTVVFNILSAVLNIFSFAALIPILQILFRTEGAGTATQLMPWSLDNLKEVLANNADYYVTQLIGNVGPTTTLLLIGLFLAFATFLKTGAYFLSSATIIPIRTGVVRDIRNQLYHKITSLPLGFFSEERKGDIIARMTGDVGEIESSIMSSLDMLFKNPILIISYFTALLFISWQLTLFTLVFVPIFGWFMGFVGRKLKRKSIAAQSLWSDTMSQVEETLGGLRIIKAFCAEDKMNQRFDRINSDYRNSVQRVNIRQQMAHPMSEFLGTVLIIIVLWVGGILVLDQQILSGPTFIYYLVMLYSIINPLKDFSKAGYNIPKGLASMERVDKILKAENTIKEPAQPKHIASFEHQIEFRHVSFRYGEQWVLKDINLVIEKGKTVALVGQSGSGKSTLVDLIPRYYDVQEGEVLIDGINVKDLGIHDLRQLIGNVNQEAILVPQQHHLRRRQRYRGTDRAGGTHCQRSRIYHADRARLRHQHWRPWWTSVWRTASACEHCTCYSQESAYPHPRRGNIGSRHRERASGAGCTGAPDEDSHHRGYSPPPLYHQERRRDMRDARRRDCGAWHTRRADSSGRIL